MPRSMPLFAQARWQAALIMSIVWVSFRPFGTTLADPETGIPPSGGDIINQLGFGALGVVCIWLLVVRVNTQILPAFRTPIWVLALPVLATGAFIADNPSGALRAMVFSLIVLLAAATALALPKRKSELVDAISIAVAITVGFCYCAVFFVPTQGVHSAVGFEAQHAGLWRGVFDHKNVASYVMGAFVLMSVFIMRNGRPLLGAILATMALIFVLQAGSKTVLGVLPVAIATAMAARWVTFAPLRAIIIMMPVLTLATVTLGAVLHPPILEWLRGHIPDLSYTGRTDLWVFGLEHLAKHPWTGHGFESFWGTQRVAGLEQPIELNWDVRGIVHGHNSWLDLAIAFGVPGAVLLIGALVVLPIRDFMSVPQNSPAVPLANLYISMWIFTSLGASLESFFFRRADPVWFCMIMAIIGLRIAAHMTRKAATNAR
ncbi:MAG: O-antigen ligase [Pseudomonadota bacterium]